MTLVLLLSNLVTIVLAVYQQWDVYVLMWIYWGQSVIIGYFNVRRIMDLKKFSTTGFKINNRSVKPTPETQRKTAVFFALHYGFFHFGYLVFLTADTKVAGGCPDCLSAAENSSRCRHACRGAHYGACRCPLRNTTVTLNQSINRSKTRLHTSLLL